MTVDPSQVFNDHEYRRRQAAAVAEAEAARKAAEAIQAAASAESSAIATSTSTTVPPHAQTKGQSQRQRNGAMSTAGAADPDSAKKEQMELEMTQMIEKMRDYKAKDPGLFSQIWEQVKKVSYAHLRLNLDVAPAIFPGLFITLTIITGPGCSKPAQGSRYCFACCQRAALKPWYYKPAATRV